jgi:hypothetical protein
VKAAAAGVFPSTAFSLDRASSAHEFLPTLANVTERERARLTKNEILAVSAHPLRAFVRSRTDSGLTQYGGQWTAIECEYPIPYDVYKMRAETPLPAEHPSCITVPAGEESREGRCDLANEPLPVTAPSRAVDTAIAERLRHSKTRFGYGRHRLQRGHEAMSLASEITTSQETDISGVVRFRSRIRTNASEARMKARLAGPGLLDRAETIERYETNWHWIGTGQGFEIVWREGTTFEDLLPLARL